MWVIECPICMGLRVRVEKRGRIVIPSEVRRALGVREGSELVVRLEGGRIVLLPVVRFSARDLYGVAGEEKVDLREVEEALGDV